MNVGILTHTNKAMHTHSQSTEEWGGVWREEQCADPTVKGSEREEKIKYIKTWNKQKTSCKTHTHLRVGNSDKIDVCVCVCERESGSVLMQGNLSLWCFLPQNWPNKRDTSSIP